MNITSSALAVAILATTLLTPQMAEASATTRLNASPIKDRSRPVHRSVERATRSYRAEMATLRRAFARRMRAIEEVKDIIAPEQVRSEAPTFTVDEQGHTPYYRALTRRHVRHLYWVNEFRQTREAEKGEGALMKPEMPQEAEEVVETQE
jgi:hypothetical protein